LSEGQDNPTKESIKDAVSSLEKELEMALAKGKKIGTDVLNSILGKFKERLEGAVVSEDKSSEKEAQAMYDKGNTDINKDWDPPSKKQLPLQKESIQVNSLTINIKFKDEMSTIEDAEGAIKEAFKRYRLGTPGPKHVTIYDDEGNTVGSLEVK
jgi:hypothetical protein